MRLRSPANCRGGFFPAGTELSLLSNSLELQGHLWPHKTAAHLAAIAGKDERAAKRWLAGEFEPPPAVFLAIFAECLKREGE